MAGAVGGARAAVGLAAFAEVQRLPAESALVNLAVLLGKKQSNNNDDGAREAGVQERFDRARDVGKVRNEACMRVMTWCTTKFR